MIPSVGSGCCGAGAEERRAIAVVVIGGQTLCLLLTLLVTPVAYSLFEDLARVFHWRPSFGPRRRPWRKRLRALERWTANGKAAGGPAPVESAHDADVSRL